jgi:dolichyl-phosphate beta-glucosyltransferase
MKAAHRAPSLSIVIPAFNEEQRLPRLIEELAKSAEAMAANSGFNFMEGVIVDDGSSDSTPDLLREAAAAHPFVRFVSGNTNRGKGAAIAAGVRAARGDYSLLTDIDLSTPLSDLSQLARAVHEGADIAIGSRVVGDAVVKDAPTYRKRLGQGFNLTVRALTGLSFGDTQCGFKLLTTAAARELLAVQVCRGWAYDVELLMRARLASLDVAEIPVSYVHDSRSQMSVASASVRMLLDVVELSLRLRTRGRLDRSADKPNRDPGRDADAGRDQPRLEPHRQGKHIVEGARGDRQLGALARAERLSELAGDDDRRQQHGVEVGVEDWLPATSPRECA